MKILFITHSGNLTYGAAKSLGLILGNIDFEYDLLCEKYLTKKYSIDEIRQYTGNKVNKIYSFWLPYEDQAVLMEKDNSKYSIIRRKLSNLFVRLKSLIDKVKIYRIIKKESYDMIYLNSIVLYPLISKKYNFIIHIRELYSGYNKKVIEKKVNMAKAIIFIDYATKNSFSKTINEIKPKKYILNNPFDMKYVKSIDSNKIYQSYNINKDKVIFSIIGVVEKTKGVDFVINQFMNIKNKNAILLVVGSGDKNFVDYCKSIAFKDKRIYFLDEIVNIGEIYAISDYIIRGDIIFAIGRTIYEALYSSCDVIIPGLDSDKSNVFEFNKFEEKIHFYIPRNEVSLIDIISNCAGKKVIKELYYDNINKYITNISGVFNEILK